jgi:glycosyltransferase involved in cell wall biosynthesis
MKKRGERLLFYSSYAFLPQLYSVFEELCPRHGLQGHVIAHERAEVPRVYSPSGYLTHESAGLPTLPAFATVIPKGLAVEEKSTLLKRKIQEIKPDFIWAHEEPNDFFVNQILTWFRNDRQPRIIVYLAENIWPDGGGSYRERWAKFRLRRRWSRYDGVLACATKSAEAIRNYGMPASVPISIAWAPNLPRKRQSENANSFPLPKKQPGDFFVGFAGRITAAKGWRVLLAALTQLPENFKCLIAGGGEEETELRQGCETSGLRSRVHCLGVLDTSGMSSFYSALDVFVLPSLTTARWTEQFGFVLAESMACGVPVIGSNSGAIPEVIGDCGIIVPENDSKELAVAIQTMANDENRRSRFIKCGRDRFEREFSIHAYAEKIAALLGLGTMKT